MSTATTEQHNPFYHYNGTTDDVVIDTTTTHSPYSDAHQSFDTAYHTRKFRLFDLPDYVSEAMLKLDNIVDGETYTIRCPQNFELSDNDFLCRHMLFRKFYSVLHELVPACVPIHAPDLANGNLALYIGSLYWSLRGLLRPLCDAGAPKPEDKCKYILRGSFLIPMKVLCPDNVVEVTLDLGDKQCTLQLDALVIERERRGWERRTHPGLTVPIYNPYCSFHRVVLFPLSLNQGGDAIEEEDAREVFKCVDADFDGENFSELPCHLEGQQVMLEQYLEGIRQLKTEFNNIGYDWHTRHSLCLLGHTLLNFEQLIVDFTYCLGDREKSPIVDGCVKVSHIGNHDEIPKLCERLFGMDRRFKCTKSAAPQKMFKSI